MSILHQFNIHFKHYYISIYLKYYSYYLCGIFIFIKKLSFTPLEVCCNYQKIPSGFQL